jgi:uncharacterized membrane protein YeaQ/YmgE (transglycosylase-associated protein family)
VIFFWRFFEFELVFTVKRINIISGRKNIKIQWKRGGYMSLLTYLIIGLIAGWFSSSLMEGRGYGLFGDLIIGVIGAFLGGYIFAWLGISAGGFIGNLVMAAIGAIVLLFVVNLFRRS